MCNSKSNLSYPLSPNVPILRDKCAHFGWWNSTLLPKSTRIKPGEYSAVSPIFSGCCIVQLKDPFFLRPCIYACHTWNIKKSFCNYVFVAASASIVFALLHSPTVTSSLPQQSRPVTTGGPFCPRATPCTVRWSWVTRGVRNFGSGKEGLTWFNHMEVS